MPEIETISVLIEEVIEQSTPLLTPLDESMETGWAVAYPIFVNSELEAVSVLIVDTEQSSLQPAMSQLRWGCGWIELALVQKRQWATDTQQRQLSTAVDLLAKVLAETSYDAAAMRLVSELAAAMGCDLVSVGSYKNNSTTVHHLSHSAEFTKRMNLVRCIESAMDEAIDQARIISLPAARGEGVITFSHEALSRQHQGESILTIPLYRDSKCVGAVTLQRSLEQPFTQQETELCESAVTLVASALEEKRLNDRPLWQKAIDAGRQQLQRLLGAGYLGRKLTGIGLLAVSAYLSVATGENRLSADAALTTAIQRVVVAPFDGYVRNASVRAGDKVNEGELLVALDDRDLQLEKLRWNSHQKKLDRQYQEAAAAYDRAKVNIIAAQQDQAKAQLELVESQITRSQQKAPFDGLVIRGDLSQRLGGQVNKGEVLFEVSPLDAYRVDLKIPESRIADIQEGQSGSLLLSALPDEPFSFVVDKITPKTLSEDGATWFVVEASLKSGGAQLRPGMEGIGKVSLGEDKRIAIWTRGLTEWMRLQLWSWWA
ncbi:HlyD family efflux transporter periplasmic adaptor subunit [Sansalvadorimonas verongulae]|uniref:HlyD family efflux transporter periplasmic adaptor subunit n=1 Tax=Sansalvadorimonas verongulae TaxID=2172824 RepID=UPI0018AD23AE|nr:HlyD family efflux transporter periplasmic adaptor subunit [Sansalvadorimonas verongulae]